MDVCMCGDVCTIHCFPIEVNKSSHAGLTVEQIKNSHEYTTACQSGVGGGGFGWDERQEVLFVWRGEGGSGDCRKILFNCEMFRINKKVG